MSRAMKDSKIPFAPQIPETWKEIPNRFLFIEHSSKVGERWKDYQLLSLTTSGVKEKNINDTGGKVPDSYDNYQTVEKGDMVLCLFDLDCSAVFSVLSTFDGMITSAYDVFRTNEKYLDNTYARFWFDYVFSRRYYKMFSKNIRYTITADVFKSIYTPCPPIAEQKRIGAFLNKKCGEIDEMVSLQEKIVEELKAYKQSVITEAVCKGLDPDVPMKDSGIEWIGQIPEGWRIMRIKNLSHFYNGYAFDSNAFSMDKPIPVIRIGDISATLDYDLCVKVDCSTELTAFVIQDGDVLIAMSGATTGKCCLVSKPQMAYINQRVGIIRGSWNKFVFYALQAAPFFEYVSLNSAGSAQPNISATGIGNHFIAIPNKATALYIADYLDKKCGEIDTLISVRQSKIDALKEYKKSIIYEYITGKKEING